jgi:hypothetical protein
VAAVVRNYSGFIFCASSLRAKNSSACRRKEHCTKKNFGQGIQRSPHMLTDALTPAMIGIFEGHRIITHD